MFGIEHDEAGNLPSLPAIFPDQLAHVVRAGPDGARTLAMMRWGFHQPRLAMHPRRSPRAWGH